MSNATRTLLGSTRTALMSGSDVDGRGLGLSFLLHAGVMALIIIGPPSLGRDLGPVAPPVPIEVIDFDTFTRLANNDPTEELADEPQLAVNQPEPEPTPESPPVEQAPAQPEVPVTPPAPPPPTPEPIVEPAPEPIPEPIPAPEPTPEAPAEPEPAPPPPTPVPRSKPTPPPPPTPQAEAPEPEPQAPSRQDFLASVLRNLDDSEPQPRSDEAIAEQLQRNRAEATASSISVVTRGTSDRLTASQADALRRHVGQFWNIDAGAQGIADMVAVVEITLNQQREVVRVQLLEDQARYNRDGFYRSFTERAMRAVKQASPLLPLPLDGYQSWRTTIITFSPRDMF